jgi:hypothetical protein
MGKKGVSAVVTTVILLALALIAVGIVWAVIQNILVDRTDMINIANSMVELEIESVNVVDEGVNVAVKRKPGKGEMKGIRVAIGEQVFDINGDLAELATGVYLIPNANLTGDVAIAPILETSSGTGVGGVADTQEVDSDYLMDNLDGLVGYWPFEGNVNDASGNGNDGTNNGVEFVDGKVNSAGIFDGVGDDVSIGTIDDLISSSELTIGAWIKLGSGPRDIYSTLLSDSWSKWFFVFDNSGTRTDNHFYFRVRDLNGLHVSSGDVILPDDDAWHHVAGVADETKGVFLYVDGALKSSSTESTFDFVVANGDVFLGSKDGTEGEFFNGEMDEIIILNRALSEGEINSIYSLSK